MITFAAAGAIKELVGVLTSAIEDPDTYKKLEALRTFLEQVTGKEIDKGAFLTLLETTTQGESYSGGWEEGEEGIRRFRVDGGYIYHVDGCTNMVHVKD